MNYYGMTDKGRKRENNEDTFICARLAKNATVFVVCDGMGGEAGGAEASLLAIKSFVNEINAQIENDIVAERLVLEDPESDVPMILDNALAEANFRVWQESQDVEELHGMGTTLVGAFVMTEPLAVWTVNLGDSRLYLVNETKISQVTKDHSYVQYLVDTGAISAADAEKRTDKNIITRAVGISVRAEPDIAPLGAVEGESLLFCSDGLSDMLSNDEIYGVAALSEASLEERVNKLVALANNAGGDDNITVIMVEL